MKNDLDDMGSDAYSDCRTLTISDQGGLCAYCEIDIRDSDPLRCRVEHFHPKSDRNSPKNWALDWQNMLGVCNGGSYEHVSEPGFFLEPMENNLSCDAFKDRMIQGKKLLAACEGYILNPLQIAASPSLFSVHQGTGVLSPDRTGCETATAITLNSYGNTETLVQHTINVLNLNCDRLCQARLRVVWDIERNKKQQREKGFGPGAGLANLADQYFRRNWPAFFTVIRGCLGAAAEEYLVSIQYQG